MGKSIFVSSASGLWPGTVGEFLEDPVNHLVGVLLEIYSRWDTQSFVSKLRMEGGSVETFFPNKGVHDWPTWNEALIEAKPYIEAAVG